MQFDMKMKKHFTSKRPEHAFMIFTIPKIGASWLKYLCTLMGSNLKPGVARPRSKAK
jgi:hypothetical protein